MKNTYVKYFILCISFILLSEILKKILNFDHLVYNSLSEKLSQEELENYFKYQKKWLWLSYLFIPFYFLIKTSIVACVLYIGTSFFNKINITFKKLFDFVINAEFIFLLVPFFKIVWFYLIDTNYNLQTVQYFYPLSVINFIGYKGMEVWFIYPLQILNLFEVAYWFILAYYLGEASKTNTDKGLQIVLCSYVPALVLWVVVVMFITLNIS